MLVLAEKHDLSKLTKEDIAEKVKAMRRNAESRS